MSWQSEPNTPAGHVPDKPEKFTLSGTPSLLKKFLFPEEKKTDKSKKAPQEKPKKKALPENFADELMEYELEIERDNVEIEVVNKLTELYLVAMEYYQADAHKYKIFEKKFQGLLLRPNVQASMTRATEMDEAPDLEREKLRKIQDIEAEAAKVNKEREAFEIIQMHENDIIRKEKVIANDINKQKASLKERLEKRKANKNNRATSLPPYELESPGESSSPVKLHHAHSQVITENTVDEKPAVVLNPPVKGSRRESRFYKLPIHEQDEDEERPNTPPKHEVFKAPASNSGRRPSKAGDLLPGVLADRRNSRRESFNREIEGRSSRSDSSKDSRKSILMKPISEENLEDKVLPSNNTSQGVISPPVFSPEHDIQGKIEGEKKSSLLLLQSTNDGQIPEPIRERSDSSSSSSSDSDSEEPKKTAEVAQNLQEDASTAVEQDNKSEAIEEPKIGTTNENTEVKQEIAADVSPAKEEEPNNLVETKLDDAQESQVEVKQEVVTEVSVAKEEQPNNLVETKVEQPQVSQPEVKEEVVTEFTPIKDEQANNLVETKAEEPQESQSEVKQEEILAEKVNENTEISVQENKVEEPVAIEAPKENKEEVVQEQAKIAHEQVTSVEEPQPENMEPATEEKKEETNIQQPEQVIESTSTSEPVVEEQKEVEQVQIEQKPIEEPQVQIPEVQEEKVPEASQPEENLEPKIESEIQVIAQEIPEQQPETQENNEDINNNPTHLEEKSSPPEEAEKPLEAHPEEPKVENDTQNTNHIPEQKSTEESVSQEVKPENTPESESQPQQQIPESQEKIEHPTEQQNSQQTSEPLESTTKPPESIETKPEGSEEAPGATTNHTSSNVEEKNEDVEVAKSVAQPEAQGGSQANQPPQEETKTEIAEIQKKEQNPIPIEPEPEKKIIGRARRESEEIEAKKLEILRRIEADQEKELKEFTMKQTDEKDKKLNSIEAKYQEKAANNEGSQEQLESQKQEEIKIVTTNYLKEIEKFKKKLQMQKMFKMNQLVS